MTNQLDVEIGLKVPDIFSVIEIPEIFRDENYFLSVKLRALSLAMEYSYKFQGSDPHDQIEYIANCFRTANGQLLMASALAKQIREENMPTHLISDRGSFTRDYVLCWMFFEQAIDELFNN